VCPDESITADGGGSQNIFDITGEITNRKMCVQYSRRLTTSELSVLLLMFICTVV